MRLFRVRFTAQRIMVAVLVFFAVGIAVGWMFPTVTWHGPAPRTLRFRVLDAGRGVPVPGARVALVHPSNPEQPPIEGVTDANGEVELHSVFWRAGGTDAWGRDRVTYFTYRPWEVEAQAEGFEVYAAALGEWMVRSLDPPEAREPLRLSDPALSPVFIRLKPVPVKAR